MLHRTVPRLTSLKLRAKFSIINVHAAPMISFTKPASHITALDIDILEWDYMWLYYFCYKYPNLRKLRWNVMPNTNEWTSGNYSREELLSLSKEAFKHLETFEFYADESNHWMDTIFWELIYQNNVPIRHIKHISKSIYYGTFYHSIIIRRSICTFSKTLEKLFVEGSVHFKFHNILRTELSYCPRLVDLELKNCGVYIALDDMLDKFTALRRFSFSNGQLYLSSDRPEDSIGHGLHTVELNQVVANASVYNYLSFRCRGLEYMTLAQCRICGSIPDNSERMLIDMSYTTFKSLHLDEVKSYSSEQRTTKDTILNLLTISQSTRAIHSSKESEIDDINPDVIHISWYHFFWESDYTFDYIIKIRKMPMDERTTALKYYYDPKSRKARAFSDMERSVNGQVTREYWEQDLCRGYAEFRCSHIAKLTVNVLQ
ncbi:hypothetical protein CLU79DRAFT_371389 [Phycomyces nitens]|nr:hypothetical protein CLU79DRAFT_371389 [Phycomyces nitens]